MPRGVSMNNIETVNIEALRQQFPTELINPYGEVLVIPSILMPLSLGMWVMIIILLLFKERGE